MDGWVEQQRQQPAAVVSVGRTCKCFATAWSECKDLTQSTIQAVLQVYKRCVSVPAGPGMRTRVCREL
jgi:hypothetical protein